MTAIWTQRLLRGRPLLPVASYLVGDTLVDTGIAGCAADLARLAGERGVRRALLSHHHEDHVGGAAALAAGGVAIFASAATRALVRRSLPVRFYQHVLWGPAPAVECTPLPGRTALGPFEAEVIAAPGHAVDQVVFYVRERAWLFSGDVFAAERIRVLRGDEDWNALVATLERLAGLEVEALFCAHRPVVRDGGQALARKLAHLRELEAEVRDLARQGLGGAAIARRLGRGPGRTMRAPRGLALFSGGDVSTRNLVRSILAGPRPRREVWDCLAAAGLR